VDWTPLGGTSAMARASASPPARGGESKRFARGTDHRTDVELPLQGVGSHRRAKGRGRPPLTEFDAAWGPPSTQTIDTCCGSRKCSDETRQSEGGRLTLNHDYPHLEAEQTQGSNQILGSGAAGAAPACVSGNWPCKP